MSAADWGIFREALGVAFVLSAPRRCALSCFPSAADSRAEPLNAAFACQEFRKKKKKKKKLLSSVTKNKYDVTISPRHWNHSFILL